ncbi:MAG: hypothetical protein J6U71_06410 [Bacteroidales bacterium]|nr:hypothetical protein [Bacteroidales bacterium]
MKKFLMFAIIPLMLFITSCEKNNYQPTTTPDLRLTMWEGIIEKESIYGFEKYNIRLEFYESLEELTDESASDNLRFNVSTLDGENVGVYYAIYVQTGSNICIYNTHTPLDAGEYWITAASDNKMEMSVLNGTTEVRLYLTRLSL